MTEINKRWSSWPINNRGDVPEVKIFYAKLGVFDLNFAVQSRDIRRVKGRGIGFRLLIVSARKFNLQFINTYIARLFTTPESSMIPSSSRHHVSTAFQLLRKSCICNIVIRLHRIQHLRRDFGRGWVVHITRQKLRCPRR